ncbi:putative ATP-dependent DNA helicase RecS [Crassostrea virginica]
MAWREKIQSVLRKHIYSVELKEEQTEILSAVIEGKDVFAQLPTGYGKSLIYTLIPLLLDELHPECKHTILVISPLRALIMRDQVQSLNEHNVKATAITDGTLYEELEDSSIIFSSPEAAVLPKWKKIIRKTKMSTTVFDEAHCISQWGLDFRPDYRKVSTLQSWLSAPTLVLTATATSAIQKDIYEVLGMTEDNTKVIAVLPDRPNIFLHLEKITENVTEVLQWLPGHFKEDPKKTRKMILYVRSINTCQQIFNWILDELQDKIFCGEKIPENRIVEMFHASTDEESKERIMESFICPSGQLKLLISTVAFGMGVNIPDVDLVLHWGIPPSSLSYWQEIGRCARDGRDGYAICYAFKRSISKCNSDDLKTCWKRMNRLNA